VAVANTQAYYDKATIADLKSFIILAPSYEDEEFFSFISSFSLSLSFVFLSHLSFTLSAVLSQLSFPFSRLIVKNLSQHKDILKRKKSLNSCIVDICFLHVSFFFFTSNTQNLVPRHSAD
jgi:hypothetical protein